ncbi:hypothetical protein [uncultured Enterovirga sp.]|uniref:hypothetical protein n=1 Tax=uncultured Enterovirga sp. TaxID=2026352 RepID=UPI0035CA1610
MTLAYIVRCTFKEPSREDAWNSWYSGPKLKQMLSKPHFLTGQRFHRVAGEGREYVAFWTLASEQAFTTPEYTTDWGFFEWAPYIGDWSRDLFEGVESDVAAPKLSDGQLLRIVSCEGLSSEEADAAKASVEAGGLNLTWLRSVGLDRHTALLGFGIVNEGRPSATLPAGMRAADATYRPISILARSESGQALEPA